MEAHRVSRENGGVEISFCARCLKENSFHHKGMDPVT